MSRNYLYVLAFAALLTVSPVAFAKENGGHGTTENPNTMNVRNHQVQREDQDEDASPSPTSSTVRRFGDNDEDELIATDEHFEADSDVDGRFATTGTITNITDTSVTLSNGKTFLFNPSELSYLTENGVLAHNTKIQVIGNRSQNGNTVSILKIMDPTTGKLTMVRLHTNAQVTQSSVTSTPGHASPLSGLFAHLISFLQSILSGNTGESSPTPSPSMLPSSTPSFLPTESPVPSTTP